MYGGTNMKVFYCLVILFDAFMIWLCGGTMFDCFSDGKSGLAALNLLGVIFWTILMIDDKNDLIKEREKEKNEKKVEKNLED